MSRITTEKPTEEMSMYELAHNSCYNKEGLARYRDFEKDIDARDFARQLMVAFGLWKSCELYGSDADNELVVDDIFDETMLENLMYEPTTITGLIALFYRNLWAMANLHHRLKCFEEFYEAGRLIELPCKVGDYVYDIVDGTAYKTKVIQFLIHGEGVACRTVSSFPNAEHFGTRIFLTKEEAERKLAELKGE